MRWFFVFSHISAQSHLSPMPTFAVDVPAFAAGTL